MTVDYDATEQVWTIDFGDVITDKFITNGGITFYMVLKDLAGNTWGSMSPTTDANTYIYTIELDEVAPVMEDVLPAEGALLFGPDDTLVLTVDAADLNLYELEIDHILESDPTLPEFSVYASETDPYGGDGALFASAGVTVDYDATEQVWTIDFGDVITDKFITNGGITFYMVLKDLAGNTWGSMSPTTDANTYIYTIELDEVAPVMESVAPGEGLVTLGLDETFVLIVDALDLNLYELEIDHSFEGTLPEFSVYASEATPWGTQADKDLFDAAGVTIDYDADLQQWTIDFGEEITDIFIPGGVTFYMVLIDEAGNTWGSMSPPTGDNTFAYTFEVTNTLEPEITSAVSYEYTPVYEYVGVIDFDDPNNIFTATYSPAEFLAGGAMNDLARYLGALYRQDGSTVISIVYDAVTYTWDETGLLKGSNWEDASGNTLVSAMVADYLAAPGELVITVGDGWHTSDVTFELVVTNTLEAEIASAPSYPYADGYVYVGDSVFDDLSNTYTNTYSPAEFLAEDAMNDLARYLGALYRQDGSTVISIVYDGVTYTWDETGTLKGSNWEDASGDTLVEAMVAYYFSASYDPEVGMPITVHDGLHTSDVTFRLLITNTLDDEIESAPSYVYTDYTYVGTRVFDDATNIYTVTYDDVDFNPNAMYDLARYLGALYRQDGSTVISIVYGGETYTWDAEVGLQGSNWVDSLGNTLVSKIVEDFEANLIDPMVGLVLTVSDGVHTENVTFKFVILDTIAPVVTITGVEDSISGEDLPFSTTDGYVFEIDNISSVDRTLQFTDGTVSNETLKDEYFGLYLVESTVSAADLKAYYATRGTPDPYLTYLNDAADGLNPFVYIKEEALSLSLVDAAQHDISPFEDVDMTIPDDFPVGTYTVQGVVEDAAGNQTTVTLTLTIEWSEEAGLAYVVANTVLSSVSGTITDLTATFPASIPAVIVDEDYVINSRMTLSGDAIPAGSTVTIMLTVNGGTPFAYVTDAAIPVSPFWVTDLVGGTAADFEASYGGRVEFYSITINSAGGNPLALNGEVLVESVISKDGFTTETVLDDISLDFTIPADEEAALAWLQANTVLSSVSMMVDDLTATFPDEIPAVIVDEDYVIDSRMTLAEALPAGTTVTIYREGVAVPGLTGITLSGTGPFYFTELFDPDAPRAAFDGGYGGTVENYVIEVTGPGTNPLDFETTVFVESVISKDGFATETVLDDITLGVLIPADELAALEWLQANTVLSSVSGTIADLKATFPASIPPVIVAEDYVIDSRITLSEALPEGVTVTVLREGSPILTDLTLSGTGPFWFTELFDPDAQRAAFDAGYGGAIETYSFILNGAVAFDYSSIVTIESVISEDDFTTETVLDDIDLAASIAATEAEALNYVIENTILSSVSGTIADLKATFPDHIPPIISDGLYVIDSRLTLAEALPLGTTVTVFKNGAEILTDITLSGTGPFWFTTLFNPDQPRASFDESIYAGAIEDYVIVLTGPGDNPLDFDTTLKVESVLFKFGFATETVLDEIILDVHIDDAVAPEMVEVLPIEGLVTLAADETFVMTVKASDPNLYELEIDHSFEGTLPEFSVYASEETPWGTDTDKDMFDAAGVSISYDADLQQWTIDFGEDITDIFIPGGVTFYMVLIDEAGNTWGSMSPPTGENTYAYTFEVTNTLEPEITSAVTYEYTPVYEYVGEIAFDDPNNIFTATYSPAEFLAGGAMNDLARYLGALYRQDGSTVISIVYDGVTYTWDETGTLKGSNWEDASGNTLVSAMVADYLAAPGELVITVSDGWHTSDVTFRLLITNTLDDEIESAPNYVYTDYTYVGDYAFVDATNIYTVTYDDVEFNPNAMYDLARYLGALYRQDGATVISIVYDGVTYTWDEAGTLKGSNWEDASGNTLVSAVVAGIGSYDPALGLVFTVSDGVHTETVTFKFVILDTIAPVVDITAATVDGVAMDGDLETGYILPTTNDPEIDHLLQITATVDAPLADEYFGLYFVEAESTVSAAELQAYYAARGTPDPYLTYLNNAADGVNPFVYIRETGLNLSLVDAAKHDIQSTDVDMTVPDDFPLGTYVVRGMVADEAGNETEVTLILIVTGDRVSPIVTISSATADGVTMGGDLATGYVLITENDPAVNHLLQIVASSDEPLADSYFGLYLTGATPEQIAALEAYYADKSEPYKTYLLGALDGTKPFVYIEGSSLTLVDAAQHDLDGNNVPMVVPDDFPVGTYTVQGVVTDEAGNETAVILKLIVVRTLAVTDADLFYGTDPLVIDQALDGTFADGFVMELDPTVAYYYLDTDTITANNELADGMYLFYLDGGPAAPIFYVKVEGTTYTLIDAFVLERDGVETPLRINGDFTPGTYTYTGDLTDIYGSTAPVSIEITFVNALAVTDADLFYGTDPLVIDQALDGTFADGFVMELDPTVAYYYLDTNTITANNELADGMYPFYLDGGPAAPIFYVKVEGTTYTLIDAFVLERDGVETPLRINGDFTPGTYTYTGDLTDIYGSTAPVSIEITFVDALAWLQANTVLSSVSMMVDDLTATFPTSIPQVIVDEDYVIDSRMTLAQALPDGTTVTVYKDGVAVLTDITLSGVGPFWFTELFAPDAPRADFDANYGGKVEEYSIVVTGPGGNVLDFETTVLIESVISKDGFATETVLDDITLGILIPADELAALEWLQANTVLSSVSMMVDDLTATFPTSIPPVIVAEDYVIDSRMTLAQALPDGTTVTVYKDGVAVLTDITLSGVGPFWFTELFDPDAPRADFDANYGGKVEEYSIVVTGPAGLSADFDTTVLIESVISKDGFVSETVLDDITLGIHLDDVVAPEIESGVARSASHGDVNLVDGKFTVDQGFVVDAIEITMDEDVLVDLGTIVTMQGYGPYGTVSAHDGALITITPYAGNEIAALIGTFTFTVPDGSVIDLRGNAFVGSIMLEVLNVAPVAVDDAYMTDEDVVLNVPARGVLVNDTDFDPAILTAVMVTEPADGTLVLNADGSFTYTPDADFNGTDSFTYKANDGLTDSNTATVTITVTEVKDQVIAVDDAYETDEDNTLTIAAPGVLANDIDVDFNIMTAGLVTNVEHGTLSLKGDGSFTYDPDPDFFGTDSFVYQLVTYPAPQSLWTDEATVTITVNPVGDAPELGLIEDATIPELVEFSFTATATDVDLPAQVLTFSLVGAPDGAVIDAATGVFTWTPSEEQGPGVYTFTVVVCDDTDPTPLCDEQDITLTVTETNAAPVAQDLSATTPEETPVDVTLVATDAEDDALTYAIVDQPAHGTVTLVGTTATYTPELDFNGEDSFTYMANDGNDNSNVAMVIITVTPVNDAPVAVDDEYTVAEKETLTIGAPGVLANDYDVDGDTLTAILVDTVTNGALTLNADGSFTYIPTEYFNGTDSFTYKASDGELESDLAVVTITVTPVNDWPIANDDFYEVVTGTDLVKNAAEGVLANDVLLDPDEEVSIQILDEPQHGTLSMNDDGSFTYTPNPGYMGTDTFRYLLLSVRINAEWSDDALVTITVKPYMRLFLPLIMR